MEAPSKIYIDPRVARTLSSEPSAELLDRGIKELCYVSVDRATELVRKAQADAQAGIPQEIVVQVIVTPCVYDENRGEVYPPQTLALTNLGRIFEEFVSGQWALYKGPDLTRPDP